MRLRACESCGAPLPTTAMRCPVCGASDPTAAMRLSAEEGVRDWYRLRWHTRLSLVALGVGVGLLVLTVVHDRYGDTPQAFYLPAWLRPAMQVLLIVGVLWLLVTRLRAWRRTL